MLLFTYTTKTCKRYIVYNAIKMKISLAINHLKYMVFIKEQSISAIFHLKYKIHIGNMQILKPSNIIILITL